MLVKSVRGAYGGYMLAKDAEAITAGDIIRVLEGPISPVEVLEDEELLSAIYGLKFVMQ